MGRGFDSCSRHHLPFRGIPLKSDYLDETLGNKGFTFHRVTRLSVDSVARVGGTLGELGLDHIRVGGL